MKINKLKQRINKIFFSSEKRKSIGILLTYFSILILFFFKTFTNTYIHGDFVAYWLPNYHYVLQSLQNGVIPLWQPYSYLGLPELFKIDLVLFYPGAWLVFIVNLIFNSSSDFNFLGKSMEVMQYSNFLIASFGMYLLLFRKLSLSRFASFSGGLIYGYSIFMVGLVGDMSSLPGKAYFPLIIYFTLSFLKKNTFKNYFILVILNFLLLTFGYPYNYLYIFLAELGLSLFFGFRKFITVGLTQLHAIVLASFFLLPYLHILDQSFRGVISTIFSPAFHTTYAFTPTKIINIINPQVFGTVYDVKDPHLLFTMGRLSWGVFPFLLLVTGIVNFGKNKLNIYFILLFIAGLLISLGGYLGVPEFLGTFIPVVEKLRSHWQALILTFFAGCIFLAQGVDIALKGVKNKKTNLFLWELVILLTSYLMLLPFWCESCTNTSGDVVISTARTAALLVIGLILLHLIKITKNKTFLIAGLIISLFEFNFYLQNLNHLRMPTSYSNYYARNSLIPEVSSEDNLFRYSFETNQFRYNSSQINVFSIDGYESLPYQSALEINKLEKIEKLSFLNTKYIVTTKPEQYDDENYELVKKINPDDYNNEVFMSSVGNLPYWTEKSKNNHFIFKTKNILDRFFVPESVKSCTDDGCLPAKSASEEVLIDDKNFSIKNSPSDEISINVNKYSANEIILDITSPTETFIASSEIWDKGWNIEINNIDNKIYKVNGGFRGFIVPKGNSMIRMYYVPPNLYLGSAITLLGLVFMIIISRKSVQKIKIF